ncbi:MAG: class I SAM-dependent RNA methyltransferase [Actinomycetales bacterium]|nr:class I SAM-dependent RNA methyltransferase [Actinomycetales bacterium]
MPDPTAEERVRIERPATGGGVGRLGDGRVVFVRDTLPGELVEVTIEQRTSSFARASLRRVLEPSADRVAAACRFSGAGGCGGCDLQHASSSGQTSWKEAVVAEQLRRVAGYDVAPSLVLPPSPPHGSRTRLRCAVDDKGRLALRASRSHTLVPVNPCWLVDPRVAEAFTTTWSRAEEVELRAIGDAAPFAVVKRPAGRSVRYDVCDLRGHRIDPAPISRVLVSGTHYNVSPQSFWQSHVDAPSMLLDRVTSLAGLQRGDRVVDLYCGVGLFAVALAAFVGPGGRVVGVESSPHAVRDARENGTGHSGLRIRQAMVTADAARNLIGAGDVVVADPPRAGLAKGVAAAIVEQRPRRVVYVSCDAATFARDLKVFLSGGFSVSHMEILDLFPMTEHVELVALLDIHP